MFFFSKIFFIYSITPTVQTRECKIIFYTFSSLLFSISTKQILTFDHLRHLFQNCIVKLGYGRNEDLHINQVPLVLHKAFNWFMQQSIEQLQYMHNMSVTKHIPKCSYELCDPFASVCFCLCEHRFINTTAFSLKIKSLM